MGVGCDPNGPGVSDRAVLALGIRKLRGRLCPALIAEVEEVLTQRSRMRKWIALDVAEHFVETLRVLADVVPDPAEVEATTRDVDDDYLVALAREHGADYIVTGDKDLLEWPDQRPPVLSPAAFAELVEE
ncbi:MAG: putative toxin-antitoxin system toxin component, PIN family [Acidimicrobiales bacterium]